MTSPDISIFSVKTAEQLRAFLYVLTPVVVVALGVTNTDLWVGLALAVISPALSAVNTVSGFRTWLYGVIAAGQAVLLGLNVFTEAQISPWIAVVGAVIGAAVAAPRVATK